MVRMPEYTLVGAEGPVRLVDIFDGRSQLIVYNHMWDPDAEWQCGGCTSLTSSFTRLDFLANYDARFVIVTQGPIDEALAYKARVGNAMTWYSTANSPFGADMGAPPDGGFQSLTRPVGTASRYRRSRFVGLRRRLAFGRPSRCRNASTGSTLAARRAGTYPAIRPITRRVSAARSTVTSELRTPENRFWRNQAVGRSAVEGGASVSVVIDA